MHRFLFVAALHSLHLHSLSHYCRLHWLVCAAAGGGGYDCVLVKKPCEFVEVGTLQGSPTCFEHQQYPFEEQASAAGDDVGGAR